MSALNMYNAKYIFSYYKIQDISCSEVQSMQMKYALKELI